MKSFLSVGNGVVVVVVVVGCSGLELVIYLFISIYVCVCRYLITFLFAKIGFVLQQT